MHTTDDFLYKIALQKYCRGDDMRKFKIPSVPQSTNKCIRFPNDIIDEVENAIKGSSCSFSAFVIEAVRVALENLTDEENGK